MFLSLFSGQPCCSYPGTIHYSFDYAQQVHYPHYAQQVGPLFFKTPRRCQCFGVCSEGSGKSNHLVLYISVLVAYQTIMVRHKTNKSYISPQNLDSVTYSFLIVLAYFIVENWKYFVSFPAYTTRLINYFF